MHLGHSLEEFKRVPPAMTTVYVTPDHDTDMVSSPTELTRHPGEIRTLQLTAIDEMGFEPCTRELLSFLDTGTLREFMEHLQDHDLHHFA